MGWRTHLVRRGHWVLGWCGCWGLRLSVGLGLGTPIRRICSTDDHCRRILRRPDRAGRIARRVSGISPDSRTPTTVRCRAGLGDVFRAGRRRGLGDSRMGAVPPTHRDRRTAAGHGSLCCIRHSSYPVDRSRAWRLLRFTGVRSRDGRFATSSTRGELKPKGSRPRTRSTR